MEPLLLPEVENSSAQWKGEIGGNNGSKMEAPLSLDVEKKDMSSSMSRRRERGANSESKTEPLLPPEVENSSAPCKGEMERNNGSKMEHLLFPLMKPPLSLEVEKNDMSSNTWRTNLQEFPALPERREGEHSSFTLRHPLRTPNVKGMVEVNTESKTEPLLPQDMKEGIVEANIGSKTKPLLSSAEEKEDTSWRINLEEFPELPERRDAEHGSFILRFLRTPRKQRKANDYYKKQNRLL